MSMKRIQIAIQRISENCCVGIFEVDDLIQNAWGPCVGCCLGNMWMNKKYVFDSKLFGYTWRMLYSIYVTMRYNRNYVNRDNMNGVETLLGLCSNTDIRK